MLAPLKGPRPMTTPGPDFREVHDTLRPRVQRYLARMAGEAEAEDLAQEVFEKVSRGLEDFRGDAELSTWVYRIATNTALDRLRRRGKPTDSVDPSSVDTIAALKADRNVWTDAIRDTLEGRVIRDEMNACIREVINRLPENYRTVIILGDLEGFSDREIAEILGLSLRNAKVRLHGHGRSSGKRLRRPVSSTGAKRTNWPATARGRFPSSVSSELDHEEQQ